MDSKRAHVLAKRLRRALDERQPGKDAKIRLRIRREELAQLAALAEAYAAGYRAQEKLRQPIRKGDVLRLLICTRTHLDKLVATKRLPCVHRPSGQRRFTRGDVLDYKYGINRTFGEGTL